MKYFIILSIVLFQSCSKCIQCKEIKTDALGNGIGMELVEYCNPTQSQIIKCK